MYVSEYLLSLDIPFWGIWGWKKSKVNVDVVEGESLELPHQTDHLSPSKM